MTEASPPTAFADQVKLAAPLKEASELIAANRKNNSAPASIDMVGRKMDISLHKYYTLAMEEALKESLETAGITPAGKVAQIFVTLAESATKGVSANDAASYHNFHRDNGQMLMKANIRMASKGIVLSNDQRLLYTAAQNLGYRAAESIVKQLGPHLHDTKINIDTLRDDCTAIYETVTSAIKARG